MFDERTTVQAFVTDVLSELSKASPEQVGWTHATGSALDRAETDVLIESEVHDALIRLNPDIAADSDHADEVIYRLTGLILSARSTGVVKANADFRSWLLGERSMPFGMDHEHVSVQLIDFNDLTRNTYSVATEVTFRRGGTEVRFDHVLWVNGLPLVVGEAKSATRRGVTWADGALQIDVYQQDVPEFFVPNVLCFATDGRQLRYGAVRTPLQKWGPWRAGWGEDEAGTDESSVDDVAQGVESLDCIEDSPPSALANDPESSQNEHGSLGASPADTGPAAVRRALEGLLLPETLLDILRSFTVFGTDKNHRKTKTVCRYQQYEAGRRMADRVADPNAPRKGLIWHFQGSGKSLLMVFTAQALRSHPRLPAPTVLIVVDRQDLDTQIMTIFNEADVPNVVSANSASELRGMLASGQRKIIVTLVHKFRREELTDVLSERGDIVCLVDEAHRTQDGDFGLRMRHVLPNAVFFGLTGTPINRSDVNTFNTFGAETDKGRYLSKYSQAQSIRDKATLPLHFEPRDSRFQIDRSMLDAEFAQLTKGLSAAEKAAMQRRAARMGALIKSEDRIRRVCDDIAEHFRAKVEPEGFKAQVVVFDQEACHLYKQELDKRLDPEASEVVVSAQGLPKDLKDRYGRTKVEEGALLERFRDPDDPLKILIVTAKLLTGFDAPIVQTMYLDRALRDHTLLQAVCRVNRPYRAPGSDQEKTHGLIVDYLGIFGPLSKAMRFDEESMQQAVQDIQKLWDKLPQALEDCLAFFAGVDRSEDGYKGLFAAQQKLPDEDSREQFAVAFATLSRLWEALSPDPRLNDYLADYRWLAQIHHSVRPSNATTPLLWRSFGPKTRELINRNIHADTPPGHLETLVIDAELAEYLERQPADRGVRQLQPSLAQRISRHRGKASFDSLSDRLERLRLQYEQDQLDSVKYLKALLVLARDVAAAERDAEQERKAQSPEEEGRAALTRLFETSRSAETPVAVTKLVEEIDDIVRNVRFPGWQQTVSGEREVKRALRRTLMRYQLQRDEDLFQKAYDYIRQYY
ncbi:type I restriction endonuclease subunit R [Streptomyces phaeochromogenes]